MEQISAFLKEKKIGQSVNVRHRSKVNKGGYAEIEVCSKANSKVDYITAVYMDGKVKTRSGDIWTVKPAGGGYDWETAEMTDR